MIIREFSVAVLKTQEHLLTLDGSRNSGYWSITSYAVDAEHGRGKRPFIFTNIVQTQHQTDHSKLESLAH